MNYQWVRIVTVQELIISIACFETVSIILPTFFPILTPYLNPIPVYALVILDSLHDRIIVSFCF